MTPENYVGIAIAIIICSLAGLALNYLDTGKPFKILPDHEWRFWGMTVGGSAYFGLIMFFVTSIKS